MSKNSMIERIHLQIVREVDKKGSLTAAAESLCLTQSALSHTIKKLDYKLGTPIWKKDGRSLRFTQAGEFILKEANRLLPQLERMEGVLGQFATGEKGSLSIGMECHPCYQWLLKVVEPYLRQCPDIDVDVKQRFQFGGIAALFNHEIDIVITPDPLQKVGVVFTPVFEYEQVLIVSSDHKLSNKDFVNPSDLNDQLLYTYPVDIERLDIYTNFLIPANCSPKSRKIIEATEIMLQLVAAGRGVSILPKWLVNEYMNRLPIKPIKLGSHGINKSIHVGVREADSVNPHILAFLRLAKSV
ncbi:MAG: LysR family transcriptional regulator for metE and metH [Cellvibrionaceae bacterium]|jgi:LysR family transcriptional regulator for metE and metH